jgi:hypothetical protein
MSLAVFTASLAAAAPPAPLSPALLGVWHALRGEWERAHDAVQLETADCAWVHAALHREEGDLPNANYWYGIAGRAAATGALRDECLAIAAVLLRAGRE